MKNYFWVRDREVAIEKYKNEVGLGSDLLWLLSQTCAGGGVKSNSDGHDILTSLVFFLERCLFNIPITAATWSTTTTTTTIFAPSSSTFLLQKK